MTTQLFNKPGNRNDLLLNYYRTYNGPKTAWILDAIHKVWRKFVPPPGMQYPILR